MILFSVPAAWLALLALAFALHETSWGREGHPSNSAIIAIYTLLGAPIFGLAGCAVAAWSKPRRPVALRTIAIVANIGIIVAGMWTWLQALS